MKRRASLTGLLAIAVLAAEPAAACVIRPPATTAAGKAAEARRARERKAEIDGAEAVFVATTARGSLDGRPNAETVQVLRGKPPARIALPSTTCDPIWPPGSRLVIHASRKGGQWVVLRAVGDTPAARAAVRIGTAP